MDQLSKEEGVKALKKSVYKARTQYYIGQFFRRMQNSRFNTLFPKLIKGCMRDSDMQYREEMSKGIEIARKIFYD